MAVCWDQCELKVFIFIRCWLHNTLYMIFETSVNITVLEKYVYAHMYVRVFVYVVF